MYIGKIKSSGTKHSQVTISNISSERMFNDILKAGHKANCDVSLKDPSDMKALIIKGTNKQVKAFYRKNVCMDITLRKG